MTADMHNNKKFNKIVTDLFISGRKPNVYLVFITQSYFKVLKDGRLNTTHFFSKKFQIAYNHSPDINYNYFMNLYKNCIATPCSFLLVLLLYQSTLYVLERILKKKYKNLSWQLMSRLKMKNCNMMLTMKVQKYQHYYLERLINIIILRWRNISF